MYDPDTVRHVTGCLRSIAAEEEETAYQHKLAANKTMIDERTQDKEIRNAELHTAIGKALRQLSYMLEGDYAG